MRQSLSLALALGALLGLLSPTRAQEPEGQPPAGMVGVLRWPGLFSDDPCDPRPAQPVPIYLQPGAQTPIGTLDLIRPAKPEPQGGCSQARELVVRRPGSEGSEALPILEIAYEQQATIALAKSGAWCQLLLRRGDAWVHEGCEAGFISLEALLADKPLYLRDGALDQARRLPEGNTRTKPAGLGHPPGPSSRLSAHLLGHRRVGGQTWLRLAASWASECERAPTRQEQFELWLPLRDASGRPNVWFHPRGC